MSAMTISGIVDVVVVIVVGGSVVAVVVGDSVVVVTGAEGRFPLHTTVVRVYVTGVPRPLSGETSDPTWMSPEAVRALLEDDRAACVPNCAAILDALVAAGEL